MVASALKSITTMQSRSIALQRSAMVPATFAVSSFLGAVVLFFMEPLIGKSLLPLYGGTPSVWITCVFFFQVILLLGYSYAHLLHRLLPLPAQLAVHIAVLAVTLSILRGHDIISPSGTEAKDPVWSVLLTLSRSVGLPFFVVSTTAPLMQIWFSEARPNANPYWLYVASNAGSLVGLLAYPLAMEIWLPLSGQFMLVKCWMIGLVVLYACCGWFALRGRRASRQSAGPMTPPIPTVHDRPVTLSTRWYWLVLALCPSSLMLGVTNFLSSEIAPMPALWMVPLGLYLLSFMIAFAHPHRWVLSVSSVVYGLISLTLAVSRQTMVRSDLIGLLAHCSLLFFGAIALHGRLACLRPDVSHLTEYYIWIALGGVVGSLFNTLVAPLVFNWQAEYPLMMVVGLCLVPWPTAPSKVSPPRRMVVPPLRAVIVGGVMGGLVWNAYLSKFAQSVLNRQRSFYGAFQVESISNGLVHQLSHGMTVHGMQVVGGDESERRIPRAYYYLNGPIGQIFQSLRGTQLVQSVGLVGLGIGSLASYGENDQEFVFYEIDPAIEKTARNSHWFTYLRDAEDRGVRMSVVIGDARLKLRAAPDAAYGLLVLDAFSSDCIPVHLLTREAIQEYLRKLKPDGLLAFHISNMYVNLEPILANAASELGLKAYIQRDTELTRADELSGKSPSTWLMMARSNEPLRAILPSGRWQRCQPRLKDGIWTDDRSSLLWAMLHP